MNNILVAILICTGFTVRTQAQNNSTDSLRIDSTVNAFYQTLSFSQPGANHYDDLVHFFTSQGLLISNVGKEPQVWTASQYISGAKEAFSKQQITLWEEQEVHARTDIFGKVAQRFSTYKIRLIAHGMESLREGVNAIQLIKQNGTWLITSVAWDKK